MKFLARRRRAQAIHEWNLGVRTAVDEREIGVLHAMSRGQTVPLEVLGMTEPEVVSYFEDQRVELDTASSLLLLAEAEAVLRVDVRARIHQRSKDAVSRAFRGMNVDRLRLDEDILETWASEYPACKPPVGEFRAVLKLRYWLAHGRYWVPKFGKEYPLSEVVRIADRLFSALPGVDGWR